MYNYLYMFSLVLIKDYAHWHYFKALALMSHIFRNLLWFHWNFFSISALAKTLFVPLKRITKRRRSFSLEDVLGTIVVNLISRLIGAFLRIIIVILGLVSIVVSSFFFVLVYLFWFVLPVMLLVTFFYGLFLIITNI
jgi:hypothetical protein